MTGRRETLGARHPHTLTSINNLASLLHARGELAAAEPLLRETVAVYRETLGPKHPHALTSISNLAALLVDKKELAAAEPLMREAAVGCKETLGSQHPDTLESANSLNSLTALLKAQRPPSSAVTASSAARPREPPRSRRVKLHGLVKTPKLNGLCGRVVGVDAKSGRWAVQLDDGRAPVKLKPDNCAPEVEKESEAAAQLAAIRALKGKLQEELQGAPSVTRVS